MFLFYYWLGKIYIIQENVSETDNRNLFTTKYTLSHVSLRSGQVTEKKRIKRCNHINMIYDMEAS